MLSMKPYHWALTCLLVGPLSSLQAQDNAPAPEDNLADTESTPTAGSIETQAGEIQNASSIEAQVPKKMLIPAPRLTSRPAISRPIP
jgi:hypothetical protein